MTLNDALEGRSLKTTQLMEKGSLLLFGAAVCLVFALRHHDGISVWVALAMVALVIPAAYILSRRMMEKARQRETESRLVMHTKTYLRNEQPVRAESDIEILARAIDWRRTLPQGFRKSASIVPARQIAEPVVFDALPRRYAASRVCERRLAEFTAAMQAVSVDLGELVPETAAPEFDGGTGGPEDLSIECSSATMDEIRRRAAEGYQRIRHGGVEVGGVLFGSRSHGALSILAARPLQCEYSNGPRFVLSPRDEAALAELLLGYAGDPELAHLEPLGFYHSNTSEEIRLSGVDVRLFERFFRKPWQVALIVRPANLAPSRAGFFIRGEDGAARSASSPCEFELE